MLRWCQSRYVECFKLIQQHIESIWFQEQYEVCIKCFSSRSRWKLGVITAPFENLRGPLNTCGVMALGTRRLNLKAPFSFGLFVRPTEVTMF